MNVERIKVDFTCPECGVISLVAIGQLESGGHKCPECHTQHFFDKAIATKMRADIEDNLTRMIGVFERIGKIGDDK